MDSKEILFTLQEQDRNVLKHYDRSIKVLSSLPQNDAVKEAIRSIRTVKNTVLENKKLYTLNIILVSNEVIELLENLDYLIAHNDYIEEKSMEVFVEFTLIAYGRLHHTNTIDPKELSYYKNLLTKEQLIKLNIQSTHEILYELYDQLTEFGCGTTLARYLLETISNKKRLPKEPTTSKEESIQLGDFIIQLSTNK
jgi:hypothetical protein